VGTWTMPYITFLEGLMDGTTDKAGNKVAPCIRDFTSTSTELVVDIVVTFPKGKLAELLSGDGLEKMLKLTASVSTTNMHLFDADIRLHKYDCVEEIIDAFAAVRLETYRKRKARLVSELSFRLVKLSNRARFITANLTGAVDLRKKTAIQVDALLSEHSFERIDGDFRYLTKMTMDSVTKENVDKILQDKADAEEELRILQTTTIETMWLRELDAFEADYDAYCAQRAGEAATLSKKRAMGAAGGAASAKKKK
jgi:DNA topoisomerase-2